MKRIHVNISPSIYLPCYQHLLDERGIDIDFIYGGRDSGKSKFKAQHLLSRCLSEKYFRYILIKETHTSIKDAQWQNLKDVAEEWNVSHLFRFKTAPLEIVCLINGNKFIARGMDEPGKIKSISNPSGAWIEEGNQLTQDAFITLLTTLRSDLGPVKLDFTFNPEAKSLDFRDFWLFKWFFAPRYPQEMSFTNEIKLTINHPAEGLMLEEVGTSFNLRYRVTHTTLYDNPFCTPQRKAIHLSLESFNEYWYRVYTLGQWGNQEVTNPFCFAFKRSKHVGLPVASRLMNLYLSFDFNRNPACCSVIQWDEAGGEVRVIETIKLQKSGTDALCNYILAYYPGYLYIVTGDYSGNTASSLYEEEVTNYEIIKHKLSLTDGQIQIKPNPKLAKNQTLVNGILAYYKVTIHEVKAKGLIFDMENVEKRPDGTIIKNDRNDPAQQSDALDTFRYFCNYFLDWFKPPVAVPKDYN